MNNKINFVAKLLQIDYGNDFFDRYLRFKDVYVYTFESNKNRYIWQRDSEEKSLVEGERYLITAIEGRRLYGGRGTSIVVIGISSYTI